MEVKAFNSFTERTIDVYILQEEKSPLSLQGTHFILVLCIDCSYSMNLNDSIEEMSRIDLVKRYAKEFVNTKTISEFDKEVIDLCVITFDSKVTIVKDFAPMSIIIEDEFDTLQATSLPTLYSALIVAVENARKRRNRLIENGVSFYKPLIFVVTDGSSEGDNEMEENCKKVLHRYIDKDEMGRVRMNLIICCLNQCNMDKVDALCKDKQLILIRNADALKNAFTLLVTCVNSYCFGARFDDKVRIEVDQQRNLDMVLERESFIELS